jgi:hypothetical protein
VEVGRGHRVVPQEGVAAEQDVEARADREACRGRIDGGLHKLRPRCATKLAMGQFQHPHGAGHADGTTPTTADWKGRGRPVSSRNSRSSAAIGAVSRPSQASTRPLAES